VVLQDVVLQDVVESHPLLHKHQTMPDSHLGLPYEPAWRIDQFRWTFDARDMAPASFGEAIEAEKVGAGLISTAN
jgi:hypothetical protein